MQLMQKYVRRFDMFKVNKLKVVKFACHVDQNC